MSSKIARKYRAEIKKYLAENGLSYDKLRESPCCYDDSELIILHYEPEKGGPPWILDETPMPATLEIYLENGALRFVQTDITHKHLGVTGEAKKRTVAKRVPTREPALA
jgi:hypothetical protein